MSKCEAFGEYQCLSDNSMFPEERGVGSERIIMGMTRCLTIEVRVHATCKNSNQLPDCR